VPCLGCLCRDSHTCQKQAFTAENTSQAAIANACLHASLRAAAWLLITYTLAWCITGHIAAQHAPPCTPCVPCRLLDVPELTWQISRSAPTATTAVDGIAQLLLLLPDLVPSSSSSSSSSAASSSQSTSAAAAFSTFASGELLLSSAGAAEVQQAVFASLELLQRLLGSGLAEQAQERALEMLQQQQRQLGLAVASGFGSATGAGTGANVTASIVSGAGRCSRLCLMGLLAPEKLGFPAAEGEMCYFCVLLFIQILPVWCCAASGI
jgi:hypothetical protein